MSKTSIRNEVRQRSGLRCEARVKCGGVRAVLFHHRRRAGRFDSFANLLHLCDLCHKWIHDHPFDSFELGLLVHSWDDPELVPVRREVAA